MINKECVIYWGNYKKYFVNFFLMKFFFGQKHYSSLKQQISPFIHDYIPPIDTSIWKQIFLRTSCIGCNLNKFSMIHPNIGHIV